MRRMRAVFALAALACYPGILVAQSRRITVAVNVADSAADGIFQSALSSALRSLGDVDVVSLGEEADYLLHGAALCSNDSCNDALSYSLALVLAEPTSRADAEMAAIQWIGGAYATTADARDSLTNIVWQVMKGRELVHMTWVVQWGRNRYEQATREFVRTLDAGCFDRIRALNRAVYKGGPDQFSAYAAFVRSRRWIC